MQPFRFRAQGALDLRQREEEAARRVLAHAEGTAAVAEAHRREAEETVARESARFGQVQRGGIEAWRIGWHRSWIAKLRLDVDERHRELQAAVAAVTRATLHLREAHRRTRTLERLRDRLWRRYQTEVQRHEMREMNELAGLRFLAQAAAQGESSEHDQRHREHVCGPARPRGEL